MPDKDGMLAKVRALLAKAEAEGATPAEAEALTAKAAELMARYGIDRALLAASRPETDRPANKKIDVPNPWSRVHAHLLCGLANAMRCQALLLVRSRGHSGERVHIFGYTSDLERVEVLYTSLLLQMANALAVENVPPGQSPRAWRRSWMLGYVSAVIRRVRVAEEMAAHDADTSDHQTDTGKSTAVVLADRSLVIMQAAQAYYPDTRTSRITYSGTGYRNGHAAGQRANIGGRNVGQGSRPALRG